MPALNVFVVSSDTSSERRLDSTLTVEQLKDKLVPITGIPPQHQVLRLYASAESKEVIAVLGEDQRTLGNYGVSEYSCIKIENTDPHARPGEWNDVSAVDKFELSNEEYEARRDTVLSHLKAHKLGRFAPVPQPLAYAPPPPSSAPAQITVGARCQVESNEGDGGASGMRRRGAVRFVGEAPIGRGGVWVGVELDEPTGKGDGSYNGQRFFTCRPSHGVFVRPNKVSVGDYPELDLMDEDEDDDEI